MVNKGILSFLEDLEDSGTRSLIVTTAQIRKAVETLKSFIYFKILTLIISAGSKWASPLMLKRNSSIKYQQIL